MIPIRDDNPSRATPWITYLVLGANVAMFAYQMQVRLNGGPEAYVALVTRLGLVPDLLMSPGSWGSAAIPVPLTLFTSMFVHGGLFHLAGNMLYLWVFADNVEDAMGPVRFAVFYLLCGLGAALSQTFLLPGSTIPMVGASGAIAGVLGAYLILYPGAQVLTLVFLFIFVRLMYLPAVLLLGLWFLLQVLSAGGGSQAGVAWFAHIGGFVVGVLLVSLFASRAKNRTVPIDRF